TPVEIVERQRDATRTRTPASGAFLARPSPTELACHASRQECMVRVHLRSHPLTHGPRNARWSHRIPSTAAATTTIGSASGLLPAFPCATAARGCSSPDDSPP